MYSQVMAIFLFTVIFETKKNPFLVIKCKVGVFCGFGFVFLFLFFLRRALISVSCISNI